MLSRVYETHRIAIKSLRRRGLLELKISFVDLDYRLKTNILLENLMRPHDYTNGALVSTALSVVG